MVPSKVMTVGDWIIFILISYVPIINIIMWIYWAFQNIETSPKPSRTTFSRFALIATGGFLLLTSLCVTILIKANAI